MYVLGVTKGVGRGFDWLTWWVGNEWDDQKVECSEVKETRFLTHTNRHTSAEGGYMLLYRVQGSIGNTIYI